MPFYWIFSAQRPITYMVHCTPHFFVALFLYCSQFVFPNFFSLSLQPHKNRCKTHKAQERIRESPPSTALTKPVKIKSVNKVVVVHDGIRSKKWNVWFSMDGMPDSLTIIISVGKILPVLFHSLHIFSLVCLFVRRFVRSFIRCLKRRCERGANNRFINNCDS